MENGKLNHGLTRINSLRSQLRMENGEWRIMDLQRVEQVAVLDLTNYELLTTTD